MGSGWRNIGYLKTSITAGAELTENGEVHVMAGTVEQGQGPTTQFAQIAADQMGVSMAQMKVTLGDTDAAPYPVPTFSSISTVGTGKAVQLAAKSCAKRCWMVRPRCCNRGVKTSQIRGDKVFVAERHPRMASHWTTVAQHFYRHQAIKPVRV